MQAPPALHRPAQLATSGLSSSRMRVGKISRRALAPVIADSTGTNALRLALNLSFDKALARCDRFMLGSQRAPELRSVRTVMVWRASPQKKLKSSLTNPFGSSSCQTKTKKPLAVRSVAFFVARFGKSVTEARPTGPFCLPRWRDMVDRIFRRSIDLTIRTRLFR
jgi:hypothetical protein